MELHADDRVAPLAPGTRTFRHNPVGDLVMGLVFGLGVLGLGYGVWHEAGRVPALLWLVVGPVALISGALMALVSSTTLRSFRDGLRASNWLARVGPHGLHLNLRSYRNAEGAAAGPTVVLLSFGEIARMARLIEWRVEAARDGGRVKRRGSYLALDLAGVDTTALSAAVEAERRREAPARKGFVSTSSTKHHHVPVLCPTPETIRVDWHRGLYRALAKRVAVAPRRVANLDDTLAGLPLEERVAALVRRGERFSAIRLLRTERGLSETGARRWLDEPPF